MNKHNINIAAWRDDGERWARTLNRATVSSNLGNAERNIQPVGQVHAGDVRRPLFDKGNYLRSGLQRDLL
jgi:hypothetical protein